MMGFIVSIFLLCVFVMFLPTIYCQVPFWRRIKSTPKPTPRPTLLPPPAKDPEFYRKLREEIPTKKETAKKLITNFLRIRPGGIGKRAITLEDAVMVMDGSGSVGQCHFEKGREALKKLMEYQNIDVDPRYAMVTFASGVRRDFGFLPRAEAAKKASGIRFPGGSTNTQAGLAEAFKLFGTGGRAFSRKYVMLLTDGQSNVQSEKTLPNAQKLKDNKVEVFVVAVGDTHMHGISEMANIATFPPKDYLFRVEKMGDFLEIVSLALHEISPGNYKLTGKYNNPCK